MQTQFVSPGPVGAIVEGGLDPAEDPRWADSGAASPAEYARWAGHLCGMACLSMALGAGSPSLFALRDGASEYEACTEDADGVIKGLVYAPFAGTRPRSTASKRSPTGTSPPPESWACWTRAGG
ncbi:hypothetical protein ACH4MM_11140 [Streptomyces pratensis]|uniref:hypothetical protein n=1 Tax=Streptomyces pratensis TaxID=1169025 RepID=UPI0037945CF7